MIAEVHADPEGLQPSTLLRQLAELDRSEPPPELDRAVLEQARRAVQRGRASRAGHPLRWIAAAAVTLALAATVTSMLRPRPAAIGRRVAASSPSEARALPVSAVERVVSPARAPVASAVPVVSVVPAVPAVSVATATSDSHELSAIHPLRVRLTSTSAQQPPSKAGWPSLIETDARARVLVVIPRATAEPHPDEWLRRIRQLRAEGRTADADREWAAFSKAYASYPALDLDPPAQPHGK